MRMRAASALVPDTAKKDRVCANLSVTISYAHFISLKIELWIYRASEYSNDSVGRVISILAGNPSTKG